MNAKLIANWASMKTSGNMISFRNCEDLEFIVSSFLSSNDSLSVYLGEEGTLEHETFLKVTEVIDSKESSVMSFGVVLGDSECKAKHIGDAATGPYKIFRAFAEDKIYDRASLDEYMLEDFLLTESVPTLLQYEW